VHIFPLSLFNNKIIDAILEKKKASAAAFIKAPLSNGLSSIDTSDGMRTSREAKNGSKPLSNRKYSQREGTLQYSTALYLPITHTYVHILQKFE
jgi:hypothetical protein